MNDVRAVKEFLESTTIQFKYLPPCNDKDGEEIRDYFTEMGTYAKQAKDAYKKEGQDLPTLVFIFYSGHGRVENGQTYICDIKGEKDFNIDAWFVELKNKSHCVGIGVMDCCREQT